MVAFQFDVSMHQSNFDDKLISYLKRCAFNHNLANFMLIMDLIYAKVDMVLIY